MHRLAKLLAAGAMAAGMGSLAWLAPLNGLTAAPPEPKAKDAPPPPPRGGPRGPHDLKKTYDDLSEVSAAVRAAGKGFERDARPQLDAAKRLYRDAVKAADGDDPRAAREQALAAHDAARGLRHLCNANRPADPDLPKPPGPEMGGDEWRPARDELQRAKDRLADADKGGPAGREFPAAAKRAYADAKKAYEDKEYDRAAELARAAEAWTHVGEHLTRAAGTDAPPAPRPDRKAPRPPPSSIGPERPRTGRDRRLGCDGPRGRAAGNLWTGGSIASPCGVGQTDPPVTGDAPPVVLPSRRVAIHPVFRPSGSNTRSGGAGWAARGGNARNTASDFAAARNRFWADSAFRSRNAACSSDPPVWAAASSACRSARWATATWSASSFSSGAGSGPANSAVNRSTWLVTARRVKASPPTTASIHARSACRARSPAAASTSGWPRRNVPAAATAPGFRRSAGR